MKSKKYLIPLMAAFSIWVAFFPAYVHSYILIQADFLVGAHWENSFQEGLLAGLIKKWEILGWHACSPMPNEDHSFFEFLRRFSLPKFSPSGQILILRC